MERRPSSPPEPETSAGQFGVCRALPGCRPEYGTYEGINGVSLDQWYEDVVADRPGALMIATPTGALEVDMRSRDFTDRIDGALFL